MRSSRNVLKGGVLHSPEDTLHAFYFKRRPRTQQYVYIYLHVRMVSFPDVRFCDWCLVVSQTIHSHLSLDPPLDYISRFRVWGQQPEAQEEPMYNLCAIVTTTSLLHDNIKLAAKGIYEVFAVTACRLFDTVSTV